MKLKEGDKIPNFELLNQNGELINMEKHIGNSNLVIYFYPKDDTPGCTAEACSFRDSYEEFSEHNCKVFGISADDVESHRNFAQKHRLNFDLLSDTENKVRELFGVPQSMLGLLPGRVTYIVDKKGLVRKIFNSQFQAKKHIRESLDILKKYSAGLV